MIPKPDKRPNWLNDFIILEDWFTYKIRIEKILGIYRKKTYKRLKFG